MFALKTDQPQRRHAHCILGPRMFVFMRSKADKIPKFQGRYLSRPRKKCPLLWDGRKKPGDWFAAWLQLWVTQHLSVFFSVSPKDSTRTSAGPSGCVTTGQPQALAGLAFFCAVQGRGQRSNPPGGRIGGRNVRLRPSRKGKKDMLARSSKPPHSHSPASLALAQGGGTDKTRDLFLLAHFS